jgi:hypothetical protein
MSATHPSRDRREEIRREYEASEKLRRERTLPSEPPQRLRTAVFWIALVVFSAIFWMWLTP